MKQFQNKVICGDALKILPKVPDESVDLVFADPPFNVGKDYGGFKDRRKDYYQWCEIWIEECFRILKPTGSFYLMTLTRHLEKLFPMLGTRGHFINLICWRNVSASHSKRVFWNSYQPIMLYGKTEDYIFNTYAETRKILDKNLRWGGYSTEPKGQLLDYWDDIPFVYAGSIAHKEAILKKGTNRKLHACQMPLRLARRALLFSTNKKALVVDPFMGSGTVLVACKELDRKYLGIDLSSDYCKMSEKRIVNTDPLFHWRER